MLASGADFEFRGSIVVSIFACHAKTRIQFPARNAALCTCQRSSAQAGPDSAHIKFEQRIVYTSRFVRVILAQGPC